MAIISDKLRMIQKQIGAYSSAHSGRHSSRAQVIAISSQKGGVGKTTTAVNLAAALAKYHKLSTLLIDLDPQGHVEKSLSATILDGIDYLPMSSILLNRKTNLLEGVIKTSDPLLHITPGDKSLYETEGMLTGRLAREYILSNALSEARTRYDLILIDCPPNLGNLTVNALCAADHVMIPCEMSVLGFEGVSDLLETIDIIHQSLNQNLKVLGVVFTRVDRRNVEINKLIEDNIGKMFKGRLFTSKLHINTDLNKAQLKGESIFDFAPSSSGAKNYRNLADEVVGKIARKRQVRPVRSKARKENLS